MGCSGPRPAFVLLFCLLENTLPQFLQERSGEVRGLPRASISPLCAGPLCFYMILHLSTSSAGFLCPAPFPWRARWSICPGVPIYFLVPSDNCEDGHWGCLSAEACFGVFLTSGGFSSSGRKGEGGVLGCGHSCYGSVEPTALGTGSGRGQDEVMGVEDGGRTRRGQMSISGWLSSWDLDSELRCGFQSCVTLGQSLAQEQNGVVTKPSQVGWRANELQADDRTEGSARARSPPGRTGISGCAPKPCHSVATALTCPAPGCLRFWLRMLDSRRRGLNLDSILTGCSWQCPWLPILFIPHTGFRV